MKPNGRRRWRKLARKHRQKCAHPAMRAVYSVKQAMKDRRTGYDLKPIPPPAFTPRSLVGMSQGARKMAAGRLCDVTFIPFPNYKANRQALRQELAGKLRIGERAERKPSPKPPAKGAK